MSCPIHPGQTHTYKHRHLQVTACWKLLPCLHLHHPSIPAQACSSGGMGFSNLLLCFTHLLYVTQSIQQNHHRCSSLMLQQVQKEKRLYCSCCFFPLGLTQDRHQQSQVLCSCSCVDTHVHAYAHDPHSYPCQADRDSSLTCPPLILVSCTALSSYIYQCGLSQAGFITLPSLGQSEISLGQCWAAGTEGELDDPLLGN